MVRCVHLSLGVVAAIAIASCGDHPTSPAQGTPGIQFTRGSTRADTALAWVQTPIEIVVRGVDGRPLAGTDVHFAATAPSAAPPRFWVGDRVNGTSQPSYRTRTDGSGVARATVRLGRTAGQFGVLITAPGTGYGATATLEIQPGAATGLDLPTEGWAHPGVPSQLDVFVVDQHGNRRPEIPALAGWSGLAFAGSTVTAPEYARGPVEARYGALVDTFMLSVGPRGRISVTDWGGVHYGGGSSSQTVVVIELGTSARREVARGLYAGWSDWSPADSTLVLELAGVLLTEDRHGRLQVLPMPDVGLNAAGHPSYGSSGEWIYFTGRYHGELGELWRVSADGSSPERIGPAGGGHAYPSPSPDESRIVFGVPGPLGTALHLLDISTGEVESMGRYGVRPQWSPSGEWIAYTTNAYWSPGSIRLIRPDGTGGHAVGERRYAGPLAWSPDGEWVVAYAYDLHRLEVIQVATGLALPIPDTFDHHDPSWGH